MSSLATDTEKHPSPIPDYTIHTAVISGYAIEADLVTGRLTGKKLSDDWSMVFHLSPDATKQPLPELKQWPTEHDLTFSDRFAQSTDRGVAKLNPRTTDDRVSFKDWLRPFDALGGIIDALRLRFEAEPGVICNINFMRCGPHPKFSGNNLWMLKHLCPAIVKDVRRASGQITRHQAERSGGRPGPLTTVPTTDQLRARLSKTESVILNHLLKHESEREVAEAMQRSPHTIHVHVKSIYRKLIVTSRKQLLSLVDHDSEEPAPELSLSPSG